MGGQLSVATSSNIANIQANTNVATNESCGAQQFITIQGETIVIGTINCAGGINLGNVTSSQVATCNNQQQVSVLSKVVADQTATSKATNGLGFLNAAIATAQNYIDVQNNITAIMQSSCQNMQNVTVGLRTMTAQNIISQGTCNIFSDSFTQNSACLNNIIADITNSTDTNQSASATASNGLDLGQLIILLILILVILLVLLILPFLLFSGILGGAVKTVGGVGRAGGATAELAARLAASGIGAATSGVGKLV